MLNNKFLVQAAALTFLTYIPFSHGANKAPENTVPNSFAVQQGASIPLLNIAVKDDALGKIKVTVEIPAGQGSLNAKSSQGVVANKINSETIELLGTVKQLNQFFSSKKTAPTFTSNPEFPGQVQLSINTNDLGQGSSQSGAISLPEINGETGINRAPAGWKLSSHTPDIIAGNGPWPGGKYVIIDIDGGSSPFGGSMGLFLERADGSTPAESWKTQVSGLTPGGNYTFRLAWQQSTVKKEDGSGPIYSGGQLKVLIDGKENLFSSTGPVAGDGWQYADLNFIAEKNSSEIQIGVQSNTSNADGESIVVDTGITPIQTTTLATINVTQIKTAELKPIEPKPEATKVKSIEPNKANPTNKVVTTSVAPTTPVAAKTNSAVITSSGYASTGKLSSAGGLVPQPTIDIIPSVINVANVTEVPVAGTCLTGATINVSCYNSNNSNSTLTPTPVATCTASNAYSTTLNMTALADDTVVCTASQVIGNDASAQSARDTATKATANMSVASITTLEAPVVGSAYKQNIMCTNNGISTAQNASCAISGLPTWASSSCPPSNTSSVKAGESISCQVTGIPNSAMPINATATTGSANDDVASNNSGKLSSSSGTVPAPSLNALQATINSKEATAVKVSGQCIQNATVNLSCASNGATANQLSSTPSVSCSSDGTFTSTVNTAGLADGTITCHATQMLGAVTSTASNRNSSVKATANMMVPTNVTLAAPTVGTPYSQTIACTNNGTSPASNATCSITGLPSWASSACSPTPPTLVAVGGSIVCKITGTPTSATPIAATITTTSSNNEITNQ